MSVGENENEDDDEDNGELEGTCSLRGSMTVTGIVNLGLYETPERKTMMRKQARRDGRIFSWFFDLQEAHGGYK